MQNPRMTPRVTPVHHPNSAMSPGMFGTNGPPHLHCAPKKYTEYHPPQISHKHERTERGTNQNTPPDIHPRLRRPKPQAPGAPGSLSYIYHVSCDSEFSGNLWLSFLDSAFVFQGFHLKEKDIIVTPVCWLPVFGSSIPEIWHRLMIQCLSCQCSILHSSNRHASQPLFRNLSVTS